EREAFLRDLERERNRALAYTSSRDMLKQVKFTIISQDLDSHRKKVERINEKLSGMDRKGDELKAEMESIDAELASLEKGRASVLDEIGKKRKREELFREMEDARAELGSHTQALSDGNENLSRLEAESSSVSGEIESEKNEIGGIKSRSVPLRAEVEALEKKKISYSEDPAVSSLRAQLSSLEKEAALLREEKIQLEGEISRLEALSAEKKRIADAYMEGAPESESNEKALSALKSRRAEAVQMVDRLFQKERDLNEESAEIDRLLLDVREKLAVLRVQSSPVAMNPALRFLADLRGKVPGMHGTVAELIEFDPKFAEAVDASAGQRLLYMVVDDSSVAVECIKRLKASGMGRATFIPLKEVRSPEPSSAKGGMGLLMDFLRFKPEHRKAVEFLFGSTILVSNSSEAKKMGIGNARMVTLEGELFERSGIITGGKTKGGIAVSAQLSKAEQEAEALRERKNAVLADLRNIREELASVRKEKSELDVEIRKCEIEAESALKAEAEAKKRRKIADDARAEIDSLIRSAEKAREKVSAYGSRAKSLEAKTSEKSAELAEAEKKSFEGLKSVEREQQELTRALSTRKAELDAMLREAEMREKSIREKEGRLKSLRSSISGLQKKLDGHSKRASELRDSISSIEKRIGESNKALEGLLARSREFEEKLQEMGKRKGAATAEAAKLEKQRYQLDVDLASLNTRISDLSSELESYPGIQPLGEGDRDKLVESMRSLEQQMGELGDVNLAAPEQYERKSQEISEMKEKIEKLRVERNAIIDMVNSIEDRKKAAFFEAFNAVNANFKQMFSHINLGEGYLHLDNQAELFSSGLYIRVKRNNRESSLDAFSGGEKTLLALMFIFALQFFKPSPFYILDEVDQSLDKANSQQLARLLRSISSQSQFIVVTHDDTIMGMAEAILGVSRVDGISRIVGVRMPSSPA
ncbi:MAG TPA: AAA family ATPase, partial [Candidatus Bilamarchaeaceae archaeon]|nr:AAA family ATPase [Candidatus Bilamarchaeaceae archaeon]